MYVDFHNKKCKMCGKIFDRVLHRDSRDYKQKCFVCDPQRYSDYVLQMTSTTMKPVLLEPTPPISSFKQINEIGPIIDIIKPCKNIKKTHWVKEHNSYIFSGCITIKFNPPHLCIIDGKQLIIPRPTSFYTQCRRHAIISHCLKKYTICEDILKIIIHNFNWYYSLLVEAEYKSRRCKTTFNIWNFYPKNPRITRRYIFYNP